MSREPSISIVTPSFNQGAFISEALQSVKNQNYGDVEHLVIDGASQDQTTSILRRHSEMECWHHLHWISEPDRGQSDALNKGFARAQGEIVGWLNSDDRYRPGCFEHVARAFELHPEVDIVYGDYRLIDESRTCRTHAAGDRIQRLHSALPSSVVYPDYIYIFFADVFLTEGNFLDQDLHYAL